MTAIGLADEREYECVSGSAQEAFGGGARVARIDMQ
jgi:hypothetical protein